MKKLLFILFLVSPCLASGPKYSFSDPRLNDEMDNIYHDLKYIKAVTLDVSAVTLSSGTIQSFMVVGTATNDDAPTGRLGQYLASTVSGLNFPATGVWGDATSLSLTAGDWLVSVTGMHELNGGTSTGWQFGYSVTAGDFTTGMTDALTRSRNLPSTTSSDNTSSVTSRFSTATTQTVYLKYTSVSGGTVPKFYGSMQAWRIR